MVKGKTQEAEYRILKDGWKQTGGKEDKRKRKTETETESESRKRGTERGNGRHSTGTAVRGMYEEGKGRNRGLVVGI